MLDNCLWLARVMTQAKEHDDYSAEQVGRRPRHGTTDLGEQAGPPAARRADSAGVDPPGAVRHSAGRTRSPGAARDDEPGRTGRARKGTAALHDQGHRRARGAQPRNPDAASNGPAPGRPDGDRRGQGPGTPGAAAPGGVAGKAAAGTNPAGTSHAPGGRTDP